MRALRVKIMSLENDGSVFMEKVVSFSLFSSKGGTNVASASVLAVDRLPLDKCSIPEPQKRSKW